jgi:hypothetical protein
MKVEENLNNEKNPDQPNAKKVKRRSILQLVYLGMKI